MKVILPLLLIVLSACSPDQPEFIMTVLGPKNVQEMGTTLIHEHVLVDFIGAEETGYHRWDRSKVVPRMVPFLEEAKSKGVVTILECTPAYLGRDPVILKTLSQKTGVQLVTNTGLYGAVSDKYVPRFAFDLSVDSLAAIWINEFESGIENTGIKPGFIKISVDPDSVLSAIDEKIFRAALETHRQTGLTIVAHTGPDGPAFAQLALLREAGISPGAWVWTHAGQGSDEGRARAAREGAWISIDDINQEHIERNLDQIMALREEGLLDRLLIAHDAGWYQPENEGGGEIRGYTDIFTHLVPGMKQRGMKDDEINQLLITNPAKAYTIRTRVD